MKPEDRKIAIANLRAYHASKVTFATDTYFTAKYPHIPDGKDYKHIGLYESEAGKGDDVYIELVTMDYTPLDSSRILYKWVHNPNYKKDYEVKKEQYMVPVSELKVVSSREELKISTVKEIKSTIEYLDYPRINGIYQHYKGGHYKVLMLAKHSETNDTVVVYQSIHFGSYHVRPLPMWSEEVEIKGGPNVQRFKLIN